MHVHITYFRFGSLHSLLPNYSCGTIQLKAFALPVFLYVHSPHSLGADCFFNPDVYLVAEGQNAILRVETSVTVAKRFSCIVTTSDDSATSEHCP